MTALNYRDRVMETSVSAGLGAFVVAGAVAGYQTFVTAYGAAASAVPYTIEAVDANGVPTGAWEVGIGTLSGSTSLARDTVLSSSNGGAAVNFAAGSKRVFVTAPASVLFGLATCYLAAGVAGTTNATATTTPAFSTYPGDALVVVKLPSGALTLNLNGVGQRNITFGNGGAVDASTFNGFAHIVMRIMASTFEIVSGV